MPDASAQLRFDDFELDERNASLTRLGKAIQLPPKAFAVLCVLARQPGRLADKNSLLDEVWGHRFVSESVLKSTISQVRNALGDDAGEPRYIETVSRRGYRFIGRPAAAETPKDTAAAPSSRRVTAPATSQQALTPLIGRAEALAHLAGSWSRTAAGQRQLVWIAGEAGIGKSTLIDRFVAEVGPESVAHGQCVEQFGAGEPYLPVLEALKSLARRTPDLVPLMRQVAPMWLVQMPWLVADADRAALQTSLTGAGQERMVRELFELLERYTRDRPLLLVTEDLHWSDQGTLRLMDHFARSRSELRLLWIASFRLTQIIAENHPLHELRQELRLHRLSDELLLDPFSERELAEYIAERAPGKEVAESFIRTLHQHTDGLPLFVVNVLETLLAASVRNPSADWTNTDRALPIPDSLAGAVEKQLAKLPSDERAVLEAASVCGMEFRAATAAYLLDLDPEEVAAVCERLVRRQYWLRETGIVDLADGSVDTRYVFRHAVYKHVFYQRVGTASRVSFHRRAARSLETAGVSGAPATPAELASHFELGREYRTAILNYRAAANSALARVAPQEALQLTRQGLSLLAKCRPEARDELEFSLQATHGSASALVSGIAAPETLAAFERVTELYDRLPQTAAHALLLNAIAWGRFTRADHDGVFALTKRIYAVAEQADDPALRVFGHNVDAVTLHNMGKYREALEAMRTGLAILDQHTERVGAIPFYVDPEASMCANMTLPLTQVGLLDEARSMRLRALERAAKLQQPLASLVAHWCSCALGVRIDDVAMVEDGTKNLEHLIATFTVQQAFAPARWFRGWVQMRHGEVSQGVAAILDGERMYTEAGTFSSRTETLGYAIEGYVLLKQWDDAQLLLDKATAFSAASGENLFFGELRLLQARVALGRGERSGARRAIEAALVEAADHGALGVELKAALALAELPSATKKDLGILRATYGRLTEGLDTHSAVRARALLASA